MPVPFPSTTGVYPSASLYPDTVPIGTGLDLWKPECVGNGRLLVSGRLLQSSGAVDSIEWEVNNQGRNVGIANPDTGQPYGFWVYGTDPLPGTEVSPQWLQVGSHWEAAVDRRVVYVKRNDALVGQESSPSFVDHTPDSWAWDDGILYYRPLSGPPTEFDVVVTTPSFSTGKEYRVRLWADGVEQADETFIWHWPVRNTVAHMIDVSAPSFLKETQAARDIYFAQARAIADIYSCIDDYFFQTFPEYATWSVPLWENFLGLPSLVSLPLSDRRTTIVQTVRGNGGSRDYFFSAIAQQIGSSPSVIDDYLNYATVVRLPISGTSPDAEKYRAAVAAIIDRTKPSGINVSVSYATYIAGVSRAGDALGFS